MSAYISEKYLAGFMDADGSIELILSKAIKKAIPKLAFSQRADRAYVLERIQDTYGGYSQTSTVSGREYVKVVITGSQARRVLDRIRKHLVIKRHYSGIIEEAIGKPFERDSLRAYLKEERKRKSLPLPKHPSRKWLAGYFDGDGCLSGTLLRSGTARVRAHIGAWQYDTEGIELIQKAFGGSISKQGNNFQWYIDMDASKAEKFLGFFGMHSIVKRNQVDVVLGHARTKHFRDGEEMVSLLKRLNAKPQRLT